MKERLEGEKMMSKMKFQEVNKKFLEGPGEQNVQQLGFAGGHPPNY